MFLALCECAALHPDPRDADDSDQENDNAEWTVGTADYESNAPLGRQSEMAPIQLTEEGRIQAERLEAMLFSSSKTTTEEEEAPISKGDQERPLDR